jgi:hypothetical protein
MAAPQEPAYGAETQAFKVQLQGCPLSSRIYPALLDGVPIPARLAFMALFTLDDTILGTIG